MFARLRFFLSQHGRDAYNKAISKDASNINKLVLQLYNNHQLAATLDKILTSANKREAVTPNYYLSRYLIECLLKEPIAQQIDQPRTTDYERVIGILSQKPSSDWDDILNAIIEIAYSPEIWHEKIEQVNRGHEEGVYEEIWADRSDDRRGGPDQIKIDTVWVDDGVIEERIKILDKPSTLSISCNFWSFDNQKIAQHSM